MRKEDLPPDSRRYSEQAFLEKEKRRRHRERMSLTHKLAVLDRLLEMTRDLPKLESSGQPEK